jgi:hypothetical protein
VDLFKEMNEYELMTMADALVERTFKDGEVVCRQGDRGDTFYIVQKVRASTPHPCPPAPLSWHHTASRALPSARSWMRRALKLKSRG